MIKLKVFTFNPFQENSFILSDESKEAIIVDAGCSNPHEQQMIIDYIDQNSLTPVKLVNTHCHVDHIIGLQYLKQKYQIPFYAHKDDGFLLQTAVQQGLMFGMELDAPPAINEFIEEGESLKFGNSVLEVLHVPGHSPGSVVLYSPDDKFAIVGDVLFNGSIGRTDLPGGDFNTLIKGIKNKLFSLPHDTVVYPGHGPSTSIKQEYDTNPFLN